jgi:hypothetical protein
MFKSNFIVTFETPFGVYFDLQLFENQIQLYEGYAKLASSVWIVTSKNKPLEIVNYLLQFLPNGSRIFVSKISASAAWSNLLTDDQWLKNNL